jgi:hypothetical protein
MEHFRGEFVSLLEKLIGKRLSEEKAYDIQKIPFLIFRVGDYPGDRCVRPVAGHT